MKKQACLLCGRRSDEGLRLLGCLICLGCEQRLVRDALRPAEALRARKALYRLYPRTLRVTRAAPG